jgi:putative ABC transport system permease protein
MFERIFGAPDSLQIFARGSDGVPAIAAEDHARASMRARRRLDPGAADNFDLLTPEASRGFVTNITERVGAAGPPISIMALLAAIVVVANTTLASVTARTREVGVRRAVGATRRQILGEVLTESILVAAAGGAAGLAVASLVLRVAAPAIGVPLALEPSTVVFSLIAAAASGLAAGWYPARRAATSDIIAALRTE